jgi:DNA primase (bacterial type)
MAKEGLADNAKKSARCPFPGHEDKHPSFSVFKGEDGFWHWNCFAGCGEGDEITFLSKLKGVPLIRAMNLYLDMAGFPSCAPRKSHECPKFPRSHASPKPPKYPGFPVYPMSNGQGLKNKLEELAARNACTEPNTARKRRFKLVRDLRAVERGIGRELEIAELMLAFNEWYRLSQPFLDTAKPQDAYLAAFLAELPKVRVPTGEGDTLNKALEAVAELSPDELPVIPAIPEASVSWRRLAALHCEMSCRSGGNTYFLSCRDAANVFPGLSYQAVSDINHVLARLRVIKIVRVGDRRPNGKASQFQYLLSQTEDRSPQAEKASHASKDGERQNANECDTW